MNNNKFLPISIIIAAIILSLPLWKLIAVLSPQSPNIQLPNSRSIKHQVENYQNECTLLNYSYSLDQTKLLINVTFEEPGAGRAFEVIYEMDEYGRFIRGKNTILETLIPLKIM